MESTVAHDVEVFQQLSWLPHANCFVGKAALCNGVLGIIVSWSLMSRYTRSISRGRGVHQQFLIECYLAPQGMWHKKKNTTEKKAWPLRKSHCLGLASGLPVRA
jgi:hypothetical protein